MPEVPIALARSMLQSLEALGWNVQPHLEDLPHLRRLEQVRSSRVPWDEVATAYNRTLEQADLPALEKIGEHYVMAHPFFSMGLRMIGDPRRVLQVTHRVNPYALPFMHHGFSELPDGRVRLSMDLPNKFVGCTPFFKACVGEWRALPRPLGLDDAEVDAEIDSHGAIYHIRFPEIPAPRVSERVVASAIEGLMHLLTNFFQPPAMPTSSQVNRVLEAQRRWGLTRTEARVADRLASGLTPAAIADGLGIKVDTVRTHLKHAYSKTGARRQAQLVKLMTDLDTAVDIPA